MVHVPPPELRGIGRINIAQPSFQGLAGAVLLATMDR
jgi:hypothetical protein